MQLHCDHVTCVTDRYRTATVCFHLVEPPMAPESPEEAVRPKDIAKSKKREFG